MTISGKQLMATALASVVASSGVTYKMSQTDPPALVVTDAVQLSHETHNQLSQAIAALSKLGAALEDEALARKTLKTALTGMARRNGEITPRLLASAVGAEANGRAVDQLITVTAIAREILASAVHATFLDEPEGADDR